MTTNPQSPVPNPRKPKRITKARKGGSAKARSDTAASVGYHAAADLFPMMGGAEYEALKGDIAAHGLREPITLCGGLILDGRNRHRACIELGILPDYRDYEGTSPVEFVVSENLHRRHLTASQAGQIAVEAEAFADAEAKAKERQRKSGGDRKSAEAKKSVPASLPEPIGREAREEVARRFGVSARYVQDAKMIKAADPELAEKVRAGELTIPQGKREIQRRAKSAEMKAKAEAARKAGLDGSDRWTIHHDDCIERLPKLRERARLVFADPPYNLGVDYGQGAEADQLPEEAFERWLRDLIHLAANALTDDGSFWLMLPDEWAAEGAVLLADAGLTRRAWIKWYETFGVNRPNNFNRTSRHVLYFVADPKRYVFHAEAVRRPSRADPGGKTLDDVWIVPRVTGTSKERIPYFPTQVPLQILRWIVACATDPGDLVIDPVSGSATTGVAAVELGRRFVGIERERRWYESSIERLSGISSAADAGPRRSVRKPARNRRQNEPQMDTDN